MKVLIAIGVIVLGLFIVIAVFGGGQHGPGRHLSGQQFEQLGDLREAALSTGIPPSWTHR